MKIRIYQVSFDHDDGSVTINYLDEAEQSRDVRKYQTVVLSPEGLSEWDRVEYYLDELRGDVTELVAWLQRYLSGTMPG